MVTLLVIAMVLMVACIAAFIIKNKELPKSISAMVYDLPNGGLKWLWTIWVWVISVFTAPSLFELLDAKGLGFVGLFTIGSFLMAGAIPLFQESERKWHNIFATAGWILTQVCTIIICPWWMLVWLLFIALMVAVMVKGYSGILRYLEGKWVFVSEIICSLSLIGAILTKIL